MPRSRKKGIFKKKGGVIKDLTRKVFKVLNENSGNPLNYKQIAAKLQLEDHGSKQQLLLKLEELKAQKKIKEEDRNFTDGSEFAWCKLYNFTCFGKCHKKSCRNFT